MICRTTKLVLALSLIFVVGGCHHNKVTNPIANVDSKQPDKVLFDRAMDAMKHGKYDVARITLQTLINTYPDSEYIARAKLAVGTRGTPKAALPDISRRRLSTRTSLPSFPICPKRLKRS